jgi:hypothetical protein
MDMLFYCWIAKLGEERRPRRIQIMFMERKLRKEKRKLKKVEQKNEERRAKE